MSKIIKILFSLEITFFSMGGAMSVGEVASADSKTIDRLVNNLENLENVVEKPDDITSDDLESARIKFEEEEKKIEETHPVDKDSLEFTIYENHRNKVEKLAEHEEEQLENQEELEQDKAKEEAERNRKLAMERESSKVQNKSTVASNDGVGSSQPAVSPEPSADSSYQPNSIYIGNYRIPYVNAGQGSGQSVIDSNPNGVAATWGGAATFSGEDGLNTHFIAHNPGPFAVLFSLGNGNQIVVTDGANHVYTYVVTKIVDCDDEGFTSDGKNIYQEIVTADGGERITLQTCVHSTLNHIIFANRV